MKNTSIIICLLLSFMANAQFTIEASAAIQYHTPIEGILMQDFYSAEITCGRSIGDNFYGGLYANESSIGVKAFWNFDGEEFWTRIGIEGGFYFRNSNFTDVYNGIGNENQFPLLVSPYIEEIMPLFGNCTFLFGRLQLVGINKLASFSAGIRLRLQQ